MAMTLKKASIGNNRRGEITKMYVLEKKRTNLSGVISFKKHFWKRDYGSAPNKIKFKIFQLRCRAAYTAFEKYSERVSFILKNNNKRAKQATFATFISQANRKVFTAFKNCVRAKNHLRIRQFLLTYDRNHTIFGAKIQLWRGGGTF